MCYMTKNYAKFRRELLALCPLMDEREIYKNWWAYNCHSDKGFTWTLQQTPMRGVDSKYHYFYITTTPMGEQYNGIHSTLDLDDGYNGSGDEIQKYKLDGVKLKTTILEFFRTREEALAMEKYVVDNLFLVEPGVLNKVPGGDDTRHNSESESPYVVEPPKYHSCPKVVEKPHHSTLLKKVTVEMPFGESVEVPVMDGSDLVQSPKGTKQEVIKVSATKSNKKYPSNWFPFSRLGVPKGGKLVYLADNSIVATTTNDVDGIKVNGEAGSLKEMTNKLAGKNVSNCLRFWMYNGKLLIDIKNEILKKGG